MNKLTAVKKPDSPEVIAQKKRTAEAHELMAQTRRAAVALVAACDGLLDVIMSSKEITPEHVKHFDVVTRRFYRASIDTSNAVNTYAAKFIQVGPKTPRVWWANIRYMITQWGSKVWKRVTRRLTS